MATIPNPSALFYPTKEQVRSTLLNAYRLGYAQRGVTVNVSEGSEPWIRYDSMAGMVMHAIRNGELGLRNTNPLLAVGEALIEWARVFGVFPRPASSASGLLIITISNALIPSVPIPTGYVGTHSVTGVKYEVVTGASVADQGTIQVTAKSAGANTDAAAGDIVTWDSQTIAWLKQPTVVDVGGIDGGEDADDEEDLRRRLLKRLGLPAVGGNPAHTIQLAEDTSAAVWAAFDYPSVRGPGSYDLAIMGDPASSAGVVLNATIQGQVDTAVQGEKPGYANSNTTSVQEEELDAIVGLGLPLPKAAGGLGGGWKDANPWPSDAESGVKGLITGVSAAPGSSSPILTVDSTSADPPVAGRHIAVWNNTTKAFVEGTIVTVTGSSGSYDITLDTTAAAGAFMAAGQYVSPAAHHMQDYADTFVEAMHSMGPGEKTDNPDILRYARRFPSTSFSNPAALTSRQISAVESAHSEVENIAFVARYATGLTTTLTTPSIPPSTSEPPRRLALKHFAFRRVT
jgi:uncharacterized phage protein gp47/JayE